MTTPETNIDKAIVNVPTPRMLPTSITLIGRSGQQEYQINPAKRVRMQVWYEMFRQHPTLRAAVEKIAKTAVANGYRFVPDEEGGRISARKLNALRKFFRKSSATQLLRATYRDLLVFGESYWLVDGVKTGAPQKARRLHPMYVDPRIVGGEVTGWRYGPVNESDDEIKYLLKEVIQFKLDDPNSDTQGLSLLASLERTVATDLFAMKYNETFFENSAASGLILSMKNSTAEEVARNRLFLEQNYQGPQNAHKTMLLEGEISVDRAMPPPAEMQFIEGRKLNRQEILSVLDIDPTKIGINEDANRSVSKEADNTFRSESIGPIQTVVEEAITNDLIDRIFGWDDVLFEQEESSIRDKLGLMDMWKTGEQMGVFSPNFIKSQLGMKPITGGDTHYIQTAAGAIPVELLDEVAARLVVAQAAPSATLSGIGTAGQAGPDVAPADEPVDPQKDPQPND